jgi:hypothetical protein
VIGVLALAVAVPSIYTAWVVVKEARFEGAARRFLADNLKLPGGCWPRSRRTTTRPIR